VRAGAGIAILPRSAIPATPAPGLRVVTLLEPWAVRHLQVCWRKDESRLSEHARALLKQLCDG
jgi:DNA-binding transcriptional LysR family regulator